LSIEDKFPNDKATIEWLKAQKKRTMYVYDFGWRLFLEFMGMNGDKIIEDRKNDKDFKWEKRTLEFKNWIMETKNLGDHSAVSATTAVRSFFSYYRLDLHFKRTESARLTEASRKTEDYRFSVEDFKKMSDVGNLTEQYIVTAGKSFGLRAGDFIRLKRGDLEPYLDRPVPISIGEIITLKEKVKAYPFIDTDALPVIKLMIDKMDREDKTKPTDKVLRCNEIQLTRILKRLTQKAGLKTGNKLVRFHCLRKFLIDRISRFMSESKWKQIVGKKISESAYVSPEDLREDYLRAMGETTFTKPTFEGDIQKQIQKEALLAMAKTMGLSADSVKALFRKKAIKPNDIEGEIKVLEDLIGKKETQHDGADCGENFEQISESQLLSYLKAGWQIVSKLQNGEVIVKR
jgi:hypothetical protein